MAELTILDIARTISFHTSFYLSASMSVARGVELHIPVKELISNHYWEGRLARIVATFAPTIVRAEKAGDPRTRYYIAHMSVLVHRDSRCTLHVDNPAIALDVAEAVLSDLSYKFNGDSLLHDSFREQAISLIDASRTIDLDKLLRKNFVKI